MKRFYYILLIFTLAACPSYAGKNKPQLEDVFYSALEFVLTPDAVDLYRHMSDSARVNWANRFWRAMDPTPMTEANEYYEEYCHRVEYAFNYFHNLFNYRDFSLTSLVGIFSIFLPPMLIVTIMLFGFLNDFHCRF